MLKTYEIHQIGLIFTSFVDFNLIVEANEVIIQLIQLIVTTKHATIKGVH